MCNERNCVVVWAFLGIVLLSGWNENWPFLVLGHCWVFHICWPIECSTFTALSFRIWNSSTGIPSPPLPLFIVMLPKAHFASHSMMFGSRWVIMPSWLSRPLSSFLQFFCVLLPEGVWDGILECVIILSADEWLCVFVSLVIWVKCSSSGCCQQLSYTKWSQALYTGVGLRGIFH